LLFFAIAKLFIKYRIQFTFRTLDNAKPIFDKHIFWDLVFENIDYEAKASFIKVLVFERGDVLDIRKCR
jgi:hypothetical protein